MGRDILEFPAHTATCGCDVAEDTSARKAVSVDPEIKARNLKRLRRIERGRAAQARMTTDYTEQLAAQARWIETHCFWHKGD